MVNEENLLVCMPELLTHLEDVFIKGCVTKLGDNLGSILVSFAQLLISIFLLN